MERGRQVCEAMERMAGWPFIRRVFSRMDCKDGHPNFPARKSLEFVVEQLKAHDGLAWAEVRTNPYGKARTMNSVPGARQGHWR